MASIVFFLVVFVALASSSVLGQNINLSRVSNGTEDYMTLVQNQLLQKIKISEIENDAVERRFNDQLAVIRLQNEQVLNKTLQVNQTLFPLQALNLVRKYCIQSYDSQFVTHQSAKRDFEICLSKAEQAADGINSYSKSLTSSAKTFVLNSLVHNGRSCKTYTNQTLIDECVISMMSRGSQYVQGNLDNAKVYREQNVLQMDNLVFKAVKCSFAIEEVVFERLTSAMTKIDDCVDDFQRLRAPGNKRP